MLQTPSVWSNPDTYRRNFSVQLKKIGSYNTSGKVFTWNLALQYLYAYGACYRFEFLICSWTTFSTSLKQNKLTHTAYWLLPCPISSTFYRSFYSWTFVVIMSTHIYLAISRHDDNQHFPKDMNENKIKMKISKRSKSNPKSAHRHS